MPTTPSTLARLTGIFWLLTIVTGFVALGLTGVGGKVSNVVAAVTYIGASWFAGRLLSPVNRYLAMLTAILGITGSLAGLDQTFFKLLPPTRNAGFFFFGTQCFLLGLLIVKSTFIPRWVGVVLTIGGMGWLVYAVSGALDFDFARLLFPYILIPGIVGETCLTAWLLIKGVDVTRWEKRPE